MRSARRIRVAAAIGTAALIALAAACSGITDPGDRVARVVVQPANDTIVVGQRLEYLAVALDASGLPVPNVTFSWSSSHPRVAPITPESPTSSAYAIGDSVGVTKIVATAEGVRSDSATLVVIAGSGAAGSSSTNKLTSCAQLKARVRGWVVNVDFTYSYTVSGLDKDTHHDVGYSLQHQGNATMKFDRYMGDSSFATFTNWSESQASDAVKGHISMLETETDITENDVTAIQADGDAVPDPKYGYGYVRLYTDSDLNACTVGFVVSPSVWASIGSGQVVIYDYMAPATIEVYSQAIPDSALTSTQFTVAGEGEFPAYVSQYVVPDGTPQPVPGWYHLFSGISLGMWGSGLGVDGKMGTAHVRWSVTPIE
jgi:hypothetical protein